MKFGNEFWLILFREYISPKLFAVWYHILTVARLPTPLKFRYPLPLSFTNFKTQNLYKTKSFNNSAKEFIKKLHAEKPYKKY